MLVEQPQLHRVCRIDGEVGLRDAEKADLFELDGNRQQTDRQTTKPWPSPLYIHLWVVIEIEESRLHNTE